MSAQGSMSRSSSAVAIVALLSIVLVRAPVLIGASSTRRLILLLPFLLCIAWAIPRVERGRIAHGAAWLLALYVGVIVVEVLRGASVYSTRSAAAVDGVTIAVIGLFAVLLFASAQGSEERWWRLVALALAPAAYVAVNVVLYIGRAHLPFALPDTTGGPAAGTPAEILGLLGFHVSRVNFPLSTGVNSFGAIAAAGFASAGVLALRVRTPKAWVTRLGAAVCLYGLLLADSRGPLLFATGVVLAVALAQRISAGARRFALPAVALIVIGLASDSGLANIFSRGSGDLATGNGRIYIWQAVIDLLRQPNLDQVFGYGADGHITSGASLQYAYVFLWSPDPSTYSTHNLLLQTVLDAGYLGLAVLVLTAGFALWRLWQASKMPDLVPALGLLVALVVILLSGLTESVPSYTFLDALALTVLIFGASAAVVPRGP